MSASVRAAQADRVVATTRRRGGRARKALAVKRAAQAVLERLEPRQLFAATLPTGFQETLITTGFGEPSDFAVAPNGKVFVTQKDGAVLITSGGVLQSTPFVVVQADTYRDRGLDAIALDPNFATNGYVYLYYTKSDPSNPNTAPNNAVNRLSRFTVNPNNPNVALPGETVLLDNIPSNTGYHIGGLLDFGPDGKLYLGTGDGGVPFDTQNSGVPSYAQDLNSLGGKILRLDPNGPSIIPSDNPFVGQSGKRGEIWAYGFRNPFSGGINPITGALYADDVGQAAWEEVDNVQKGKNYGWPGAEGNSTNPAFTNPLYTYAHDPNVTFSACVTGGAFYTGTQFPSTYQGKYFFADYIQGWIKTLDPATGQPTNFATNVNGPIRIEATPDGSIYYMAHNNQAVYKITYVGSANRPPTAVASSDVQSGLAPLSVKFDGTASSDPDKDALSYSWNFGDGATGAGATITHVYSANGNYNATLTVNDGHGGSNQSTPIVIRVGNRAPTATISLPATGAMYKAGDTISFGGSGTDPEDGTLPASAFHWSIVFHHETHTHGFIDAIDRVKSGAFVIPTDGETDPVQWYRVQLTVTDSGGLQGSTFVDVNPRLANITLASNVPGLIVNLDGQPQVFNTTFTAVAGLTRLLGIPTPQIWNEGSFQFVSWSDGGAASHSISAPVTDTTYTATFKNTAAETPYAVGTPPVPGILEAQNFNRGGEGVGYHDLTPDNEGDATTFRQTSVDIQLNADSLGGYNIGYVKAGEWLDYTFQATAAGLYDLDARVANKGAGGSFHILIDGKDATGSMAIPDTGDWQNYTTITKTAINLTAGTHVMRVMADTENDLGYVGNFSFFQFRAENPPPPASPAAPTKLTASALGSSIDLSWTDNATNETGYSIERKTGAGGTYAPIGAAPAGATAFSDTAITAGTVYYYQVRATGASNTFSAYSNEASASLLETPFGGVAWPITGTIQAEDFDHAGEGISYHDTDLGNFFGQYRTTGVDVEKSDDITVGAVPANFDIGRIKAGEWVQYTVSAAASGTYHFDLRLASGSSGGTYHLSVDGIDKTGSIQFPTTGDWNTYQTIRKGGIGLTAGKHILRLTFDSSAVAGQDIGRVNWLQFAPDRPGTPAPPPPPPQTGPFHGTPFNLPADTIQAEDYDLGGEAFGYHDTTAVNEGTATAYRNDGVDLEYDSDTEAGVNVGYIQPGEWLQYTVNVTTAGVYDFNARVASNDAGGTFELDVDGTNRTGDIVIPDTGDYQNWTTITKSGINLTAGQHLLRLAFKANGAGGYVGNVNWFNFTPAPTPTMPAPPPPPANGLLATYYDNLNFSGPSATRIDPTVNFNFGAAPPIAGIAPTTYSVRWVGQIQPAYSEVYTFYTESDDGVRLWINNKRLISNWTNHAPLENSGTISLIAGRKYEIRMDYYQATGPAVAQLSWASASQAKQIVPSTALFSQPTIRVNAGGPAYTDTSNRNWSADNGFTGGTTASKSYDVLNTFSDPLFYSTRSGPSFNFSTSLANGSYRLQLYFADPASTAIGQRAFNVTANGQLILTNYDIVADAGVKSAIIKTFTVNVTGGILTLQFAGVLGDAIISAIELQPL